MSAPASIDRAKLLPPLDELSEEWERRYSERARQSLEGFVTYTHREYSWGWFPRLVCRELDQFLDLVAMKRSPRLMLFAPPRHGKSELATRRLSAYALGRDPDIQIIGASYADTLASRMNRDIQRVITSPEYQRVFPDTRLNETNIRTLADGVWLRNSDIFEVVGRKGSYRSVGVNGAITGMGGNILTIDDPIKDAEQAASEVYRERTWDWYRSTFYTRQEQGAGILLMLTRWHHDDLAGRIMQEMASGGEAWRVVTFPAIAEEDEEFRQAGEPLHEQRYPLQALETIRHTLGEYAWSSLYQQRPTPREGGMFKRRWFDIVGAAPAQAMRARGWDLAGAKKTSTNDPDYTVGVKMSRDYDGVCCVEHVERFRGSPLEVEKAIVRYANLDGDDCYVRLPQDPGQAGNYQASYLTTALAGFVIKLEKETGSKETRAAAFAAQCEAGNVKLLRGDWNEAFLSELEKFPMGQHDDQVDAAAGAFNELAFASTYDHSMRWVSG